MANSDLQHCLEFDCNQDAMLVRDARPLTDLIKSHLVTIASYDGEHNSLSHRKLHQGDYSD